jgi:hypothetical protein
MGTVRKKYIELYEATLKAQGISVKPAAAKKTVTIKVDAPKKTETKETKPRSSKKKDS